MSLKDDIKNDIQEFQEKNKNRLTEPELKALREEYISDYLEVHAKNDYAEIRKSVRLYIENMLKKSGTSNSFSCLSLAHKASFAGFAPIPIFRIKFENIIDDNFRSKWTETIENNFNRSLSQYVPWLDDELRVEEYCYSNKEAGKYIRQYINKLRKYAEEDELIVTDVIAIYGCNNVAYNVISGVATSKVNDGGYYNYTAGLYLRWKIEV